MRYELHIEGLDCANCALKIERAVSGLNGVQRAGLTFATGLLRIETDREDPALAAEVNGTVCSMESGAVVTPRNSAAKSLWGSGETAGLLSGASRRMGECPQGCSCSLHHDHDHSHSHDHSHAHDHGCDCAHPHPQAQDHAPHQGHDHTHRHANGKLAAGLLAAAAAAFAVGLLPMVEWAKMLCFGLAVVLAGWPVFLQALRGLR